MQVDLVLNKKAKVALIEANVTVAGLSRRLGLTRSYTSRIIHGRLYSKRARESIAATLKKDVGELWEKELDPRVDAISSKKENCTGLFGCHEE